MDKVVVCGNISGIWGYRRIRWWWYVGISVDKGVVVCGDISG